MVAGVALVAAVTIGGAASAATTVNWADLTSTDNSTYANGTITVGSDTVGVSINGTGFATAQVNGAGTNYWTQGTPAPYTGGSVANAPGTTDIVEFNQGGTKTITFSKAVTDPYLALVSWNGNTFTTSDPFTVISEGCGYWGCGTFANVTSTGFTGNGELHGIVQFTGTFTSISFTDTTENWHGLTVGIAGIAGSVPEPATWAMMIAGFGLVGATMRRRAKRPLAAA
ncbi:PEP-CTERM sorting domain-containing protein [Sphingomonas sp. CL5.1]|nr:PEP-CTERM sorting domain-containing protein [Sphingomonas sp. CL5.1]